MRGVLLVISFLALGGGMAAGYLEHSRSRPPAPSQAAPRPLVERAPAPAPPPPAPAPAGEEKAPSPPAQPLPDQEEVRAAIRSLESLILKEDYRGAARVAEEMVEKYARNPEAMRLLEKLRRGERKAKAFEILTSVLETRELPEALHSVLLSNGNSVVARTVREAPDHYEVEYVLGGTGSLGKDKVKEVKPLPRKTYLSQRWKEIQASVANARDPIDLYFFGVRKCFRDGLRKEGLTLLERLLGMPESAQVVALYARDDTGKAVRFWEEAAGRISLPSLGGAAPGPAAGAPAAETAEPAPLEFVGHGGGGDIDLVGLARAREIIERAEKAYQASETFEARILVQSSAKILYALPSWDPRVKELTRRAAEILDKVMNQ